ncbi:MAG TPA: DUF1501 domain-containing protein [Bryobacteraceae bacterium]|nr:DUF1501 domain-containing protein [Bryobacteraceae bacterium]
MISRRQWISNLCAGFGGAALADLLATPAAQGATLRPVGTDFPAKAKHVISLFMTGGPSQLDMFDPKPSLVKYAGQRPDSVDLRTERKTGGLLPSGFQFRKYGRNGIDISELLPKLSECADDLCVVKSVYSFIANHEPGRNLYFTGSIISFRPSMGSWVTYGLGTENQNLPAFVALSPGGGSLFSGSGFLPVKYQGTVINNSDSDPDKMIRYLRNTSMDKTAQREQLDFLQSMNRAQEASFGQDAFLDGRIQSMEQAYRMQFTASEVFDIRKEPESVRNEYGSSPYATGCLLARRLVEQGVRYVQVHYGPGQPWDDHKTLNKNLRERCPDMDQATAALIRDLKQRGLLDETLVVWGGEFGRTPVSEAGDGRDHNPYGFTMFMAGGGVKPGIAYGETDEFGFKSVEKPVSIHDLHATILHQLGLDHEKLTYRYAGRDFRLTDVYGNVVRDLIA